MKQSNQYPLCDIRVGDKVRHANGHRGMVTGIGPKGGAHVVWDDKGWADNIPETDLTVISRAVWLTKYEQSELSSVADDFAEGFADYYPEGYHEIARTLRGILERSK